MSGDIRPAVMVAAVALSAIGWIALVWAFVIAIPYMAWIVATLAAIVEMI